MTIAWLPLAIACQEPVSSGSADAAPQDPDAAGGPCTTISAGPYEGGTSARALAGYAVGQTFTAPQTGQMAQIDMGFFNVIDGTGVLKIHAGVGTSGALLQTVPVTIVAHENELRMNEWPVSVPVTAGERYTFLLWPDTGTVPDPYGVAINQNAYDGGSQYLVDPSGDYEVPETDLVFQVHLAAGCSSI